MTGVQTCALPISKNIRASTGSTWAVATTGIAGPGGGTPEKPVGTVWIAICGPGVHFAKLHRFGDNRLRNIQMSALSAFKMLRDLLVANSGN